MYRAKFDFAGQEGEMSLSKGEEVELVEKDDNGWWLVKRNGVEAWAPYNYLEPVPAKATPAPPPPPSRPRPTSTVPKPAFSSGTADASAKPIAVFPGMGGGNGSATPWKKPGGVTADDSTRPGSSGGKVPPPVANKPKPPVVAPKPGAPKPVGGGKPALPTAARPPAAAPAAGRGSGFGGGGGGGPGQMDLAAAVSLTSRSLCCCITNVDYPKLAKRAQRMAHDDD
jgi:myosin I